jgi:acyl-CoA thioesterase
MNEPMTDTTYQGFSDHIGISFTELDDGFSRAELEVTDELRNSHDVLHGGVLFTMADTGMGAALYTQLDESEQCATTELKINYLSAVHSGHVTCETELRKKGTSVAYLESTLENDGDEVARATGSYSIYTP